MDQSRLTVHSAHLDADVLHLAGTGETRDLLLNFDWASSPLGPIEQWPQSLKTAVGICMNSRFPMFVWWGPTLINIYNDSYVPMLGKRHPSAFGRPARQCWEDIWSVVGPQADAVMKRGEATWNERVKLVMERHGYVEDTWFTWSYSPIPVESGNIGGLFCACFEDTGRVIAESERDRLTLQRQQALDAAKLGWWHLDLETNVASYDQRYAETFGVSGNQLPLDQILKLLHPDDLPSVMQAVQAALDPADPQPYVAQYRVNRPDGAVRWIEAHGQATFVETDGERRAVSFAGTVEDITANKQRDATLVESEKRYRTLFESIDEGFCVCEMIFDDAGTPADYRFLEINPSFERLTGFQNAIGKTARELVPNLEAFWFETYARVALTGEPVRFQHKANSMGGRWFDVYASRTGDPQLRRFLIVFSDITERKTAEITLRESEARFRDFADTSPAMLWVTDPEGYCTYLSRSWYEFTGQREEEGHGYGWTNAIHPDDRAIGCDAFRRASEQRKEYSVDFRLRTKDGTYRWVIDGGRPRFDDNGAFLGFVGSVIDIHDRVIAETALRDARDVAESANAAKDRFLAVLSHELRTPLSPVVLTLAAMQMDPALPLSMRDDVAMIRRNIDLETKLIDDLLDLSRVTSGKLRLQLQPTRVHELLRHVMDSCIGEIRGKRQQIGQSLDAANDHVLADSARVQQAFWNLLKNAVKFTPADGVLEVGTSNDDGQLIVSVRDSGIGIPPEMLNRIFDAFEQGNPVMTRQFGGLGLGLAIAKAVIDLHGGTISASSEGEGKGATFTIALPLAAESSQTSAETTSRATDAGGAIEKPRILLVEDHPDTARTLAKLLTLSGNTVRTANSVAEALEVAGAESFDLVVSDIGLPDATGYELMQSLRERHGLKGIALSGYGMEEDMSRSRDAGFADHVVKPVSLPHLLEVIQKALASDDSGQAPR